MSPRRAARFLALLGLTSVFWLSLGTPAFGWGLDWCCCEKCPPPFIHCQPRPPCLKYKWTCPKPVCEPCDLVSWGYYQNCWRPWLWPPNCAPCYPPPAPVAAAPSATPAPFAAPAVDSMPSSLR
jgi:hypothetical protein